MPSDRQPPAPSDRVDPDHRSRLQRMPSAFQPRLILPEPAPTDDQGELDLPDDLAALAEQLQDDAVYLSNRFPHAAPDAATPLPGATAGLSHAAAPGATAGLSSSAPMRPALLTAAAATIALALSLAIYAGRTSDQIQADRNPQTDSHEHRSQPVPAASAARIDEPSAPDQTESLVLLGEASGPEREGLLDLLQQSASTETSISF